MHWHLSYAHAADCPQEFPRTVEALRALGFDTIPAAVPGNFELDLIRAGRESDLFYSTNTLHARFWEDCHVWYFTALQAAPRQALCFEGIDTVADIFVNGVLEAHTENMYLSYTVRPAWLPGENEVLVHLYPAVSEARKHPLTPNCVSMSHNMESLAIRKAPHMYGWDIMPRIVSCGLWKPFSLVEEKPDRITDCYAQTLSLDREKDQAYIHFFLTAVMESANSWDYDYLVQGECGDSRFSFTVQPTHNQSQFNHRLEHPHLWWPRNCGEPNLYDITITMRRKGIPVDEYHFRFGVRTLRLENTDAIEKDGTGEFVFRVNDKKVFVLGSNWVPLDAFHSRDVQHLDAAFDLLLEEGCNGVRCWGGNVYESDAFYDKCDENGILVWQDFAMACASYPQSEEFIERLEEEVREVVRRLRGHASLALWSGDNECDAAHSFWLESKLRNPDGNRLTRSVIPSVLDEEDLFRPYLPSSPYITTRQVENDLQSPEQHLWGPRDYFKSDFYTKNDARFASETGYHGCPAPASLKKFIAPEKLWPIFDKDGNANEDWLTHATCVEPKPGNSFAYRIPLMAKQVETMFSALPDDLDTFARMSQISQAEAFKFFIERFRTGKWHRTGIIWWNVRDGWPQVSDAVVDYYNVKKLAFFYIRRSQRPLCLMCGEAGEDGLQPLYAVNDTPAEKSISYTVTEALTGKIMLSGAGEAPADSARVLGTFRPSGHTFYLISWEADGQKYTNHYFTDPRGIDFAQYMQALAVCGYNEFEGFA